MSPETSSKAETPKLAKRKKAESPDGKLEVEVVQIPPDPTSGTYRKVLIDPKDPKKGRHTVRIVRPMYDIVIRRREGLAHRLHHPLGLGQKTHHLRLYDDPKLSQYPIIEVNLIGAAEFWSGKVRLRLSYHQKNGQFIVDDEIREFDLP